MDVGWGWLKLYVVWVECCVQWAMAGNRNEKKRMRKWKKFYAEFISLPNVSSPFECKLLGKLKLMMRQSKKKSEQQQVIFSAVFLRMPQRDTSKHTIENVWKHLNWIYCDKMDWTMICTVIIMGKWGCRADGVGVEK